MREKSWEPGDALHLSEDGEHRPSSRFVGGTVPVTCSLRQGAIGASPQKASRSEMTLPEPPLCRSSESGTIGESSRERSRSRSDALITGKVLWTEERFREGDGFGVTGRGQLATGDAGAV
jgi:hypothetical protein